MSDKNTKNSILVNIASQMLEAVQDLHGSRYVHQDIKPDNFRVHEGFVKIVDFGIMMEYSNGEEHKTEGRFGF